MSILIGIDGGGTSCRAIVCDRLGKHLGYGRAGSANIATNFKGSCANIIKASQEAIEEAGLAKEVIYEADVYLGLAGANLKDFNERLKTVLPFNDYYIDSDASLALAGAVNDENGIAAIIGTGSVFISKIKGEINIIGGWGFLLGDHGSGAKLGHSLLQETLLCYDKIHQGSELTKYVLEYFDNSPQAIVEFASKATPAKFGEFAPKIFEFAQKNDLIANKIIKDAVVNIEEAIKVMTFRGDENLYVLGGLGEKYIPFLNKKYKERICEPKGDALSGAVLLAVKHFSHNAK